MLNVSHLSTSIGIFFRIILTFTLNEFLSLSHGKRLKTKPCNWELLPWTTTNPNTLYTGYAWSTIYSTVLHRLGKEGGACVLLWYPSIHAESSFFNSTSTPTITKEAILYNELFKWVVYRGIQHYMTILSLTITLFTCCNLSSKS